MRVFFLLVFNLTIVSLWAQCDSIPTLNLQIQKLAKKSMGKKVGTGECWDLAKMVLNQTQADWDGYMNFGHLVRKGECIFPGDVIQFEKVEIELDKGNQVLFEKMYHHTAIVYEVLSEDEVVLIHQNTGYTGKKVGTSNLVFSSIKKGTYIIYRPQKK